MIDVFWKSNDKINLKLESKNSALMCFYSTDTVDGRKL